MYIMSCGVNTKYVSVLTFFTCSDRGELCYVYAPPNALSNSLRSELPHPEGTAPQESSEKGVNEAY